MRPLLVLGFLLSAADHWTTWLCLRQPTPGFAVRETNPVAAWLFRQCGLGAGLAIDSAVTLAALGFLASTGSLSRRGRALALTGFAVLAGAALVTNLVALSHLGLLPRVGP
jgi:hypothetical protein